MAKSKNAEVQVNPSAHTVAIAQARALAEQVQAMNQSIVPGGQPKTIGSQVGFLVLVGLTLELYLKALMIRARAGRVTKGHNLSALLHEFPRFLREAFSHEYLRRFRLLEPSFTSTAIIVSKKRPTTSPGDGPELRFETFDSCIASISDVFVRFRYLFEKVNNAEWTHVPFPNSFALAAIHTLETTYVNFEKGEFKGLSE